MSGWMDRESECETQWCGRLINLYIFFISQGIWFPGGRVLARGARLSRLTRAFLRPCGRSSPPGARGTRPHSRALTPDACRRCRRAACGLHAARPLRRCSATATGGQRSNPGPVARGAEVLRGSRTAQPALAAWIAVPLDLPLVASHSLTRCPACRAPRAVSVALSQGKVRGGKPVQRWLAAGGGAGREVSLGGPLAAAGRAPPPPSLTHYSLLTRCPLGAEWGGVAALALCCFLSFSLVCSLNLLLTDAS